jgi:hypothetical protein
MQKLKKYLNKTAVQIRVTQIKGWYRFATVLHTLMCLLCIIGVAIFKVHSAPAMITIVTIMFISTLFISSIKTTHTIEVEQDFDAVKEAVIKSLLMDSKNSKHLELLLETIRIVCEGSDLRFGQLIEVIKKDDWFYSSNKDILIILDDFRSGHEANKN